MSFIYKVGFSLYKRESRIAIHHAQIILATTMPTDNPDTSGIESYNEIIKRVAARHNLPVDDLFPLLRDNIGLIGPDHIHLKSEGYDLIGQAVTDIILKYL